MYCEAAFLFYLLRYTTYTTCKPLLCRNVFPLIIMNYGSALLFVTHYFDRSLYIIKSSDPNCVQPLLTFFEIYTEIQTEDKGQTKL